MALLNSLIAYAIVFVFLVFVFILVAVVVISDHPETPRDMSKAEAVERLKEWK